MKKKVGKRMKSLKDQIIVVFVTILVISAPAMMIVNVVTANQIADLASDIRDIKKEQAQIEKQIQDQQDAHKKLNDTVYAMGTKIQEVEKTYQYVNRGGIDRAVPKIDTSAKTYMDYRCISAGLQADLQAEARTDDQGFRRYGDDYMVAMGSYYGEVGDRFEVTLSSGKVFTVIKGDAKSDRDTDALHMHRNGNVIEFIVDADRISDASKSSGNMSDSGFEGTIKSIRGIK
jgi:hypothetical protein